MIYPGARLHNVPLQVHSPFFSTLTAEQNIVAFKLLDRTGSEEGEMSPSVFSVSPDNFIIRTLAIQFACSLCLEFVDDFFPLRCFIFMK